MHFALKVQTPDTVQESGMPLNAGVKNQGINLEDRMQPKKVQRTALAVDVDSKANKQPADTEGTFDLRPFCQERQKAAKSLYSSGQIPWEFAPVSSRGEKKIRTMQADQLYKTTSSIHSSKLHIILCP